MTDKIYIYVFVGYNSFVSYLKKSEQTQERDKSSRKQLLFLLLFHQVQATEAVIKQRSFSVPTDLLRGELRQEAGANDHQSSCQLSWHVCHLLLRARLDSGPL